jgi:hypothetical protein
MLKMACDTSAKKVGLVVGMSRDCIVTARHGCPDKIFQRRTKQWQFRNTEAVIAGLADRSLPPDVRKAMLRNLAIHQVNRQDITHLLVEGEPYQYERYQGVQKILAWAGLPPKTNPAKVQNLDGLRRKGLTELPSGIGEFKMLGFLDLGSNNLTSLPPEIGELEALRSLNLGMNRITELPSTLSNLGNLYSLDLAYNLDLVAFPQEVIPPNVEVLNLSGNFLTSLPPQIVQLPKLKHLSVRDNDLDEATIQMLMQIENDKPQILFDVPQLYVSEVKSGVSKQK